MKHAIFETVLFVLCVGGVVLGFVYAHWLDESRRRNRQ